MGAVKWGSLEAGCRTTPLRATTISCDEDVKGESGIILCVCFVCTCECERAKFGLLQQYEKRLW